MKDYEKEWIVAVSNSDIDGVDLYKITGDEDYVRKYLAEYVCWDRELGRINNTYSFICGTTEAKDITKDGWGSLFGYANYGFGTQIEYTIEYIARRLDSMIRLDSVINR